MILDRIRRWRREQFWNSHHTPLEHSGEDMADAIADGMDDRPEPAVSKERRRYYHVCANCDDISVNVLWHLELFDKEPKYQCPRCDQWIEIDKYAANRLDRRMGPDNPK